MKKPGMDRAVLLHLSIVDLYYGLGVKCQLALEITG